MCIYIYVCIHTSTHASAGGMRVFMYTYKYIHMCVSIHQHQQAGIWHLLSQHLQLSVYVRAPVKSVAKSENEIYTHKLFLRSENEHIHTQTPSLSLAPPLSLCLYIHI